VLDFLREYHDALGPLVAQFRGGRSTNSPATGFMEFFNDPIPCPDPGRARGQDDRGDAGSHRCERLLRGISSCGWRGRALAIQDHPAARLPRVRLCPQGGGRPCREGNRRSPQSLGGKAYSSIAAMRAAPGTRYWGVEKIRALYEATYFAGLRKAGVPEE
jgi:hypothetical protein